MLRKYLLVMFMAIMANCATLVAQEIDFDQQAAAGKNAAAPKFKFTNGETFQFGKLKQGQKVSHKFEFVNVGKEDLKIVYVNPSCGCTIAEWPKTPIGPGKKATISVTFDSKEQFGIISKEVFILSNAVTKGDFYTLYIKGEVVN
jgi:Protein of unknown function (DUF1573)